MYSEYLSFDELKNQVLTDKESVGLDVYTRNRYPIRFVLFDNFRDCSSFVEFVLTEMHAVLESVDKWLDVDYPDIMITHTQLAENFKQYVKKQNGKDCVIAPFSELARFYDNGEKKTFDALLKTIKAIEASVEGVEHHQRVYVPIVGLEGKMETFCQDSQSTIWRLKSDSKDLTYRLVLTNSTTFGVKGLEEHYTIVENMQEWLNIWKDTKQQTTPNIICTSPSIFANAVYAQPDNAFSYINCNDAYDFLIAGLQLAFGDVKKTDEDEEYWMQLAEDTDISNGFNFSKYVENYFSVNAIATYQQFIKLWFEHLGSYDRWLLSMYYQTHEGKNEYICKTLESLHSFVGNEFVERMAYDMTIVETEIEVRKFCLTEAVHRHVMLSESAALSIKNRLEAIAKQHGTVNALKYFTGISTKEKELAISWLAKGKIKPVQIKSFFPDLCSYLSDPLGVSVNVEKWLVDYIGEYKNAKVANRYSDGLKDLIKEHNADEVAFDTWYQRFSTVRTLLANRGDIEVFYWVDGLGIDWIPLVKEIIREKNDPNLFLNEVMIARSLLPSTTAVNKTELQKLLPEGLQLLKAGDLDSFAHQTVNAWPSYIIKELQLVRDVINEIILKYNGKKIAIISDHGISYMPQLCEGKGLAGVVSDHHGRVAIKDKGTFSVDNNYVRLENDNVACALNHNSLCSKVPKGQGIHGGCTPEEVLVPIFIISSYINAAEWSAELLTPELSGANPVARFRIKGMPSTDIPFVSYNNGHYSLQHIEDDVFETEPLCVDTDCRSISLIIGEVTRVYSIDINVGLEEDDLFDF